MKDSSKDYELYRDEVFRYGFRLLKSEADGEELAQDVFLRYGASKQNLEGAHLRNWLFRVARNLVIDKLRKKNPKLITPDDKGAPLLDVPDDKSADPAAVVEKQESIQIAIAMLAKCDKRTREIFRLKFRECKSSAEIGAKIGLSDSSVRKILLGKLKEFRKEFQKKTL